jgi:hypothetical protein
MQSLQVLQIERGELSLLSLSLAIVATPSISPDNTAMKIIIEIIIVLHVCLQMASQGMTDRIRHGSFRRSDAMLGKTPFRRLRLILSGVDADEER